MRYLPILIATLALISAANAAPVYRVDHVIDGDTIDLRNGQHVRLVQI